MFINASSTPYLYTKDLLFICEPKANFINKALFICALKEYFLEIEQRKLSEEEIAKIKGFLNLEGENFIAWKPKLQYDTFLINYCKTDEKLINLNQDFVPFKKENEKLIMIEKKPLLTLFIEKTSQVFQIKEKEKELSIENNQKTTTEMESEEIESESLKFQKAKIVNNLDLVQTGATAELFFYTYLLNCYGNGVSLNNWRSSNRLNYYPNSLDYIDDGLGYDFEVLDTLNIFGKNFENTHSHCYFEVKGTKQTYDNSFRISANEYNKAEELINLNNNHYFIVIVEKIQSSQIRFASLIDWKIMKNRFIVSQDSFTIKVDNYNSMCRNKYFCKFKLNCKMKHSANEQHFFQIFGNNKINFSRIKRMQCPNPHLDNRNYFAECLNAHSSEDSFCDKCAGWGHLFHDCDHLEKGKRMKTLI